MKAKRINRSGFAMATALFILVVAGVAMAAVGALLSADVRRTLHGSSDAELRQLLIAAEIDAPSHLSDAAQDSWTTPLPPSLSTSAKLESRRTTSTSVTEVLVTASLDGRLLTQRLRFEQSDNRWLLKAAELSLSLGQR